MRDDRALARQLAHQHLARVADDGRVDVLERRRVRVHARDVHPALVREGVLAHVRLVGVRLQVEHLRHQVRGLGQPSSDGRHCLPIFSCRFGMIEIEVRVAAALAVAVHGPLDHHGALGDRRQGVRDRALGVVVRLDAQRRGGQRARGRERTASAIWCAQRRAVGAAHRQVLGTRLQRGGEAGDGVARVVEEPVEEVLRRRR